MSIVDSLEDLATRAWRFSDKYFVSDWANKVLRAPAEDCKFSLQHFDYANLEADCKFGDSEFNLRFFREGVVQACGTNSKPENSFNLTTLVPTSSLSSAENVQLISSDPLYLSLGKNENFGWAKSHENGLSFGKEENLGFVIKEITTGEHPKMVIDVNSVFLYGLAMRAETHLLKDTKNDKPYRLWTCDRYKWHNFTKSGMYGSSPILIAHSKGQTVGFYWRNSSETYVDIEKHEDGHSTVTFTSEFGDFDAFFFLGATPAQVFKQIACTTGFNHFPSYWSLGHQHCRYSFLSQEDVIDNVDAGFDKHNIPYDVIYLDIDHSDKMKYFTFNPITYPDVPAMIDTLKKKERRIVTIVDPHIKVDPDFYVYKEANEKNLFIQNKKGENYEGECWPGNSSWIDFLNDDAKVFWAGLFAYDKYKYSDPYLHIWNDMNEPAVFKVPEDTMPKENIHKIKGKSIPHSFVKNIYGLHQAMASFNGLIERNEYEEQTRPLVLTRSFFAGVQKYAAVWTADSESTWKYLRAQIPMMLTFSICGQAYCGADVGGFAGYPSGELLVRWYQSGIFYPYFRPHSSETSLRREPWLYDVHTLRNIRRAVLLRYKMLPIWYTQFYNCSTNGDLVLKPLWTVFPEEEKCYSEDQQFMLGDSLLVIPITSQYQKYVTLKYGLKYIWYDFYTRKSISYGQKIRTTIENIPIFIKGGQIVVLYDFDETKEFSYKSSMQMKKSGNFEIVIALSNNEEANGEYYNDDGDSYKNVRNGEYLLAELSFNEGLLSVNYKKNNYTNDTGVISKVTIMGCNSLPSSLHEKAVYNENKKVIELTGLQLKFGEKISLQVFQKE